MKNSVEFVKGGKGDNDIAVRDGGSFVITGRGDDTITAGGGWDAIIAKGGDNLISVADGDSRINTGNGDDTITAGAGWDAVNAGHGDNTIDAGDGGSRVRTGNGDDIIASGDGWDAVSAGNGANAVDIGGGGGLVLTGRGADTIAADSDGYTLVNAGRGDDVVTYRVGETTDYSKLIAGKGQDTLVLDLPLSTYKSAQFQSEIAAYLDTGGSVGKPFYFCSLNLFVSGFEDVVVQIDGLVVDAIDQKVVANGDTARVFEDDGAVLQGSVLSNDAVPNGFAAISLVEGPDAGVLTLLGDGTYTFDPAGQFETLAEGEATQVTFTYAVADIDGDVAQADVTITIIGTNDAPILLNGAFAATEDGPAASIDLATLGSDIDSDDGPGSLIYAIETPPAAGTASLNGTVLSFDPGDAFQALAFGETQALEVVISATDSHGASSLSTVAITVTGTNDGPVATADTNADDAVTEAGVNGPGDATAAGNVLSNDSDVDQSDVLVVQAVGAGGDPATEGVGRPVLGTFGSLVLMADGTYAYTLDNDAPATEGLAEGEIAFDVLTYAISDGQGGTDSASLTIRITGALDNRPPTAEADSFTILEGRTIGGAPTDAAFNVLADNGSGADSDPDGDMLSVVSAGGGAAGVPFTVITASEVAALDGLALSASVSAQGDVTLTTTAGDGASLFEGLGAGQSATVTFAYTVSDPLGAMATATAVIQIAGTEDAPEISGQTTGDVIEDDAPATGGQLTASDLDANDTPGFVAQTTQGIYGTFTLDAAGVWTYTLGPAADDLSEGQQETDGFTVTATTADGESVATQVTITVTGTNDGPVPVADTGSVLESGAIPAQPTASGSVLDNDESPSGLGLSVSAVNGTPLAGGVIDGTYGTLVMGANGLWTYTLDDARAATNALPEGSTGTEVFVYTVIDTLGDAADSTLTVEVTGRNDGPTAVDDTATVTESADGQIPVLDNDTDPDDGDSITLTGAELIQGLGALSVDGDTIIWDTNGEYEDLALGQTATVTFEYEIADSYGQTATALATVTVVGANDAPDAADITIAAGTPVPGTYQGLVFGGLSNRVGNLLGVYANGFQIWQDTLDIDGAFVGVLVDADDDGVIDGFTAPDRLNTTQAVLPLLTPDAVFTTTMASADFDGDGDTDVLLAGNESVTFLSNLGDTDGDGSPDFGITTFAAVDLATPGVITTKDVTPNGGTNTVKPGDVNNPYDVSPLYPSVSLATGDLSGNGFDDFLLFTGADVFEFVSLGDADGDGLADEFTQQAVSLAVPVFNIGSDLVDIDGDGALEFASRGTNGAIVFTTALGDTDGDGTVDYTQTVLGDTSGLDVARIAFDDLDGDGDLDFVTVSRDFTTTVHFNEDGLLSDGTFATSRLTLDQQTPGAPLALGDIDGDGDTDILRGDATGVFVSLNTGTETDLAFLTTRLIAAPSVRSLVPVGFDIQDPIGITPSAVFDTGLTLADVDQDGALDIIYADTTVFLNVGDTDGDAIPDFVANLNGTYGDVGAFDRQLVLPIFEPAVVLDPVTEDSGPISFAFAGSDIDSDDTAATLSYAIVNQPARGEVTNNGDGTFSYDPDGAFEDLALGEEGIVTFDYTATDQHGATSAPATVSITIVGQNDGVTFVAETGPQTITERPDGAADENAFLHVVSGQIAFDDVDLTDLHTLDIIRLNGTEGTFNATVDQTLNVVDWTYQVSDATIDALDGGEVRDIDIAVEILDGNGASLQTTVEVDLVGTNDAPVYVGGPISLATQGVPNGSFVNGLNNWSVDLATSGLAGATSSVVPVAPNQFSDGAASISWSGSATTPGLVSGPTIESTPFLASAGDIIQVSALADFGFTFDENDPGFTADPGAYSAALFNADTGTLVQTLASPVILTESLQTTLLSNEVAADGLYVLRIQSVGIEGDLLLNNGFTSATSGGLDVESAFVFNADIDINEGVQVLTTTDGSNVVNTIRSGLVDADFNPLDVQLSSGFSQLGATITLDGAGNVIYDGSTVVPFGSTFVLEDTITFDVTDGDGGLLQVTTDVDVFFG